MRIHLTSTAWHGNYHGFLSEALQVLGHEVIFFDEGGSRFDKLCRKIAVRLPRLQYAADDFIRGRLSAEWVHSILQVDPDVVILLDYTWNILPSMAREIKDRGYQVIYWVTSPPTQGGGKDTLASMKFSSGVFTIDPAWMTLLFEKSEFEFLPLAGSPDIFQPLPGAKREYDVAFVGSLAPQSWDGFIRASAIASIPEKYKVAVFGKGVDYWYRYFPVLESRTRSVNNLSFKDTNEIYNKSRIMLNLHSASHTTSFSARTFEIALAGAFQIVDNVSWRHEAKQLFPGDILQSFGSLREMNQLIDYWLPREKERRAIAEKTRKIVLARHTWKHRAESLLTEVFKNKAQEN